MMMFHNKIALTVIALMPATLLRAQNDPPVRQQPTPAPTAEATDAKNRRGAAESDAVLANWLLVASNNEIVLARLALQKAQSNEVKQFAQKMIDDHGKCVQKLQPLAAATVIGDRGAGKGESDRDNGHTGRPADAGGPRPSGTFDHTALIRDLGKKCLESETKMLNEKAGADFDRCYMHMQVAAHVKAAGMIEVFQTYASERLRPILDEGHKTVLAHLEQAKSLCKQIEKGDKVEKIGSENQGR
jgi:predicted outer membrane protein